MFGWVNTRKAGLFPTIIKFTASVCAKEFWANIALTAPLSLVEKQRFLLF